MGARGEWLPRGLASEGLKAGWRAVRARDIGYCVGHAAALIEAQNPTWWREEPAGRLRPGPAAVARIPFGYAYR